MAKKIKFYVINVKLQSHKEGVERILAYESLIRRLTEKRRFTRLNKTDAVTFYPPYEREEKGIKYFYGVLGKGISFFDKDEIKVLHNNNASREVVDKEKILEPVTGDYIFVPSIHRFGLLKRPNSVSIVDFERFLREHLPKLIDEGEKLEIDFEKEPSVIDEIFNADAVYSLSYEITYTNNDALPAQGELFDELLKNNHIGKLNVSAQSDYNDEGMNIKAVDFLGGGIEVARNNGVIKSAKIKTKGSKRTKTVTNQEKPLIQEVELINESENQNSKWFSKLKNLYN